LCREWRVDANLKNAPFLANALQQAFTDSGQRADAVFSAHAHLFERLTYTFADKTTMPCLIVGCGGHSLENLFDECDGSQGNTRNVPFDAVMPDGFTLPTGDRVQVEAYEDVKHGGSYGFIEVGIEQRVLTCTFYSTSGRGDRFSLNLDTHEYIEPAQLV
jgi:hypothetical protein